jgi:hypothetical protein
MKIEHDSASRTTLINGVESYALVVVEHHMGSEWTIQLGGAEVKAKVYRDGVLMADTTRPPLVNL